MKLRGITKSKINLSIDIVLFILLVAMAGIGFLMKYVTVSGEVRNVIYGNNLDLEFLGLTRHQWGSIHLTISIIFLVMLVLHIILHWKLIISIYNRMFPSQYLRYGIAGFICLFGLVFLVSPFFLEPEKVPFEPKYRGRIDYAPAPDNKLPESTENRVEFEPRYRNRIKDVPLYDNKVQDDPDNEPLSSQETVEQGRRDFPPDDRNISASGSHEDHHNAEYDEYEVFGYHTIKYIAERYGVPVSVISRDLNIPENLSNERLAWLRRQYGFTMTDVRKSIYDYKKLNK